MKRIALFLLMMVIAVIGFVSFKPEKKSKQPVLGTRTALIIENKGFKFRDLNKNGMVDPYEDWRLSPQERSKDLLSRMSVQQKAGFMLINTINMTGSRRAEASGGKLLASDLFEGGESPQGAGRREGEQRGIRRPEGTPRQQPADGMPAIPAGQVERFAGMGGNVGTTKMVKEFQNRHFILRMSESAKDMAEWANKLQALCESEPLGIPAIVASNPRNHVTTNASLGTSVGNTVFSMWPGELGLSAMRDLALTRDFADIARQEWAAVGLRKGYMYMADLSTEPRWSRVNGTFGENAEWVAQMTREIVLGFQGDKLNDKSVALTMKHFPGGGAGKGGQDSHFAWGKAEIFPGNMFNNNLIPFKAAIKAGTSAIMPYYSLPEGTPYEEVGYAFNKGVINDLLRNKMGFKGIINSDTGPLTSMAWGVENLTLHQRYKKAIEAGVNIFSGVSDPKDLVAVIDSGLVDMKLIDQSVLLLLKEKFELGLFENPYVDPVAAEMLVNNSGFKQKADLALRKSIVLLRNENSALPLKKGQKVYIEMLQRSSGRESTEAPRKNILMVNQSGYPLDFVKTPEEADLVVLWLVPTGNALFSSTGQPISLSLSQNAVDTEYVNKLTAAKPSILVVNYTNPWVIDEIYNDQAKGNIKGVLATFGTTPEALLDVLTGRYNPTGKMPFATPVSMKVVETQKEDVPGYLEGPGYSLFRYDEGVSYQGK